MSPRSGDALFLLRGGERCRDPWSAYRRLRDDSPVHRVDHPRYGEFWVLSRFDDVFDAVRDTTTFSSAEGLTPDLFSHATNLIERRKTEPGDDLVSDLARAGDDQASAEWIVGFVFTMVTGGNDTTTGLLSGASELLTHDRDQRRVLLDDLSLVRPAVNELLRLTTRSRTSPAPRPGRWHGTARRFRRGARSCCCMAPPTETSASSDRVPSSSTCAAMSRGLRPVQLVGRRRSCRCRPPGPRAGLDASSPELATEGSGVDAEPGGDQHE